MKRTILKWGRIYFAMAGILAVTNWFLLWSRFYGFGFRGTTQKIFRILNFPLSNAYLWIESRTNPWWNETFGRRFDFWLNDEFGPMAALLILCLLQAAIFVLLFSGFRKLLRDNQSP